MNSFPHTPGDGERPTGRPARGLTTTFTDPAIRARAHALAAASVDNERNPRMREQLTAELFALRRPPTTVVCGLCGSVVEATALRTAVTPREDEPCR